MKIRPVEGHGRQRPTCEIIQRSTRRGAINRERKGLNPDVCGDVGSYVVGKIVMCRRHAADWALREMLDAPA